MNAITTALGFQPTTGQQTALDMIETFVSSSSSEDFFILRGSAGTGKTSVVKAIAQHLASKGLTVHLAAPTGRAAKIIGAKTGLAAQTLHSLIYSPEEVKPGGTIRFNRKINSDTNLAVYIVDETSMVSDTLNNSEKFEVKKPLLTDFLDYVKQGNRKNKVLFIGDVYQLPPVTPGFNNAFSPALHPDYLTSRFGLKGQHYALTQVMRHTDGSKVLEYATAIRDTMVKGGHAVTPNLNQLQNPTQAIKMYVSLYEEGITDKATVICWRNSDVNWWNRVLRERLGYGGKLAVGDMVTTQTNWFGNYNYVYKGDTGIIKALDSHVETYADLQFADAEIEFGGNAGGKTTIKTKVLLDALDTDTGSLTYEKETQLFHKVMQHNATFRESKKPGDDKYLGAMRLRHGYATTCHKAQGGEWDHAILHPVQPKNDLHWLYTAVTRARHQAYSWAA